MRLCIGKIKPDAVVHLGDYFDDGKTMAEEFFYIPFFQVPGNCDRYRCPPFQQEVLIVPVCGVKLYMTHGHQHGVKSGIRRLLTDAWSSQAAAVLYGHTHIADCHREPGGLWVLNPGSCSSYGGTAGLIEVEAGQIMGAWIVDQMDLEEMK